MSDWEAITEMMPTGAFSGSCQQFTTQASWRLSVFYRRSALSSDLYDLVPARANTHIADRRSSEILKSINVCSGRRWQIGQPSDVP